MLLLVLCFQMGVLPNFYTECGITMVVCLGFFPETLLTIRYKII